MAGSRALWVLASSSSKAGLQERLLEERPSLLLIDELDKMDGKDLAALMSLMEGGRVTRTKVGRMADVTLECQVVAASDGRANWEYPDKTDEAVGVKPFGDTSLRAKPVRCDLMLAPSPGPTNELFS